MDETGKKGMIYLRIAGSLDDGDDVRRLGILAQILAYHFQAEATICASNQDSAISKHFG